MDKTSIVKCYDYVTLYVDLDKKEAMFVAEGKDNTTVNEKLLSALNLRKSFQKIYVAYSSQEFECSLKKWHCWAAHSKLHPMEKATKTIKNQWNGIIQWKKSQINNEILKWLSERPVVINLNISRPSFI